MGKSNSPAAQRQGKSLRKGKPGSNKPADLGYGSFGWVPLEMLRSDAFRSLSRGGSQLFWAIMHEHVEQGGTQNGNLIVTHGQAQAFGMSGSIIKPAIEELLFLGLITFVQGGRYHGSNQPNRFGMAWLWTKDRHGSLIAPSDIWKTRTSADIAAWKQARTSSRASRSAYRAVSSARSP